MLALFNEDSRNTIVTIIIEWNKLLLSFSKNLVNYRTELGGLGIKSRGVIWSSDTKILNGVSMVVDNEIPNDRKLIDICDTLENLSISLLDIATKSIDPQLQALISVNMSHTYSESLAVIKRYILNDVMSVKTILNSILTMIYKFYKNSDVWYADSDSILNDIVTTYGEVDHGNISTEFFINSIQYIASFSSESTRVKAINTIYDIRDKSIGISCKDSEYIAAEDHTTLQEYHPLQTMNYTQVLSEVILDSNYSGDYVDCSLPQSTTNVIYDITSLVDRKKSIGTKTTSGINHRNIEHLRTIKTYTYKREDSKIYRPAMVNDSVVVSMDNGKTVVNFKGRGADNANWYPFAGCRPQVDKYNLLSSSIIINGIKNEKNPDHSLFIERYEKISADTTVSNILGDDELLMRMLSNFSTLYDSSPMPTNISEFQQLISPKIYDLDNYIYSSLISLGSKYLDIFLDNISRKPKTNNIPLSIISRELVISQSISLTESCRFLHDNMKDMKMVDISIFSLSSSQRKVLLIKAFQGIALSAIKLKSIEYLPQSIKDFFLMSSVN